MDKKIGLILDKINFLENRLKVIYSFLTCIEDKEKIDALQIDFENNTDFNIDSITDIINFYKYDTYNEYELSKEIDTLINTIYRLKNKI